MGIVAVERCNDYEYEKVMHTLKKIFDNLGGIDKYIKPGMKVALKPNLVMKKPPEAAATTHPALVKALTVLIQKAGGTVTIIDSPGGPYTTDLLKGVYKVCGMEKMAKETGAKLNYDLSEISVSNPDAVYLKKLTVVKPLIDADIIINLPKLKTHGQMVYTGAVKNMFGAVAGALKAEYHIRMAKYNYFANALIDIFLAVKPKLNIMDAVIGMDGYGPTSGNPKHIGLILASEDAFSLDLTALKIIKADYMSIPLINEAVRRGLCPKSIDDVEIIGCNIEDVTVDDFEIPQMELLKDIQFFDSPALKIFINYLKPKPVFNSKTCIGCADCAKNCPAHVIKMKDKRPQVDLSECIRCFCCQELCPAEAVKIKRPYISKIIMKFAHVLGKLFIKFRKE